MKRWIVRGLIGIGLLGLAGLGALIGVIYYYSADLPDNKALQAYVPPITTRLYASNGDLMAEYAVENRVFLPIEEVPPIVKQAFLSAEDKNFYHHKGLDFVGLLRAAITNLQAVATDRRLVGGSTITQQVAKNFSLSGEVSYERKIKEAILAHRMENTLSKDRILELYLNDIYLGAGAYGIAAASMRYFGRTPDELTVAQVAYLAALPKAPNNYHPVRDHEEALARRNWVIERMAEDGYVTQQHAVTALAEPLDAPNLDTAGKQPAPWFAEHVRRELVGRFGSEAVNTNGLSVKTTMDPELQAYAQSALRDGLEAYDRRHGYRGPLAQLDPAGDWTTALEAIASPDPGGPGSVAMVTEIAKSGAKIAFADGTRGQVPFAEMNWAAPYSLNRRELEAPKNVSEVVSPGDAILVEPREQSARGQDYPKGTYALVQAPEVNGALVALDPYTGRVLAMVGGYNPQQSEFNRAVQAARQPGSAFKPFVYLTALDNGYTPSTIVLDMPFVQRDNAVLGSGWKPGNYSAGQFYGPSPLRLGLELSRNLMTVRLANDVGMAKIADTAARFSVIEDMAPVLAMALGSGETTLLKMTTAYGMLVNGGRRITPAFIDRVQDRHGTTLYREDNRGCTDCSGAGASLDTIPLPPVVAEQVDDPISIYQLVTMMQGVIERGTGKAAQVKGVPLAGKTGTTNDSIDAWFVGFSSDLAVGVYVGFDQPRTLGPHEAGGVAAAPIFGEFMQHATKLYPAEPFRAPAGVRLVRVNAKTGALATDGGANTIVQAFRPGTEPSTDVPVDSQQQVNERRPEAQRARRRMGGLY
jgi:penicillin-binding protein 1A